MSQFDQIWKSHEVAEAVDDHAGREVAGAHEEKGGEHAEDCRVGELERRDEKGGLGVLPLPDPLDHVVEMCNTEKERRQYHSSRRRIVS